MNDDPVLTRLLEKFAQADCCWFSSTRPDGRAHLAPIWHVWHAGRVYVVTQENSVRAANIAQQPAVSLALPDPMNVLIIEGEARVAAGMTAALRPLYQQKYQWDIDADTDYRLIIEVTPRKVMAWGDDGDGRWRFPAEDDGGVA